METRGFKVILLAGVLATASLLSSTYAAEYDAVAKHQPVQISINGSMAKTIFSQELRTRFNQEWIKQDQCLFGSNGDYYPFPVQIVVDLQSRCFSGAILFPYGHSSKERAVIALRGSQRQILEILLPHECNHLLLHWRFYRKRIPVCILEGTAMQFEEALIEVDSEHYNVLVRRRQEPSLDLPELLAVESTSKPRSVRSFCIYSSSYWLIRQLVDQVGMRGIGHLLEKGATGNDWEAAILEINRTNDGNLVQTRIDALFVEISQQ